MSVNVDKLKVRISLERGMKRDTYASLPPDCLLWYIFQFIEDRYDLREEEWDGLSFAELKKLHKELGELIDELIEYQTVSDDDKFTLDFSSNDDGTDYQINVVSRYPETLGQWKSRLAALYKEYKDKNPELAKIILDFKRKLYDRNNLPEIAKHVNPTIVNNK